MKLHRKNIVLLKKLNRKFLLINSTLNHFSRVPERQLLNLWKFKNFPYFPELVLLFQYIYEFTLTETFTLDDYQRILEVSMLIIFL